MSLRPAALLGGRRVMGSEFTDRLEERSSACAIDNEDFGSVSGHVASDSSGQIRRPFKAQMLPLRVRRQP
jgi:hypothetical protein